MGRTGTGTGPGPAARRALGSRAAPWLYAALGLLYLLHNDLWLWDDARLVLGLPVGLLYHLGYCLAAALLFAAVVRWAWPPGLEEEPLADEPEPGGGEDGP